MKRFIKDYLLTVFVLSPIVCLWIQFALGETDIFNRNYLVSLAVAFLTSTICLCGGEILLTSHSFLRQKFSLKEIEKKNYLLVLFRILLVVPGLDISYRLIDIFLDDFTYSGQIEQFYGGIFYTSLILLTTFVFNLVSEIKAVKKETKLKLQALEIENLKAKLKILTTQMNPHFLFNALNSIASVVLDRPEIAEEMIIKLSKLYRASLKSTEKDTHSLKDELSLCRDYLEIEKMRFEHRLNLRFEIDHTLDLNHYQIPVLYIQTLVENALKHGLSDKIEGGTIWLRIFKKGSSLIIEVEDDGQGIKVKSTEQKDGHKNSLQNCEKRLLLLNEKSTFDFEMREIGTLVTSRIQIEEAI
ncbi:histidine kinase [Halobacteriovorax sp. GB3]|uniref:sensor histidine kinase n=1 Tax=Halobacteriovorax sp. GB3 TaxID=2719615 RepID=UPI002361D472|nr:histidine kinase [Halobacteriovorax sp. GB3]MDD0853612.1 histidine kinase [Halobacteriovorax sp. GB3]